MNYFGVFYDKATATVTQIVKTDLGTADDLPRFGRLNEALIVVSEANRRNLPSILQGLGVRANTPGA